MFIAKAICCPAATASRHRHHGCSPCPVEVMKRCIGNAHGKVTICYGMTETSPVSTRTLTDDPIDKRVSTVGRVTPSRSR
jgi:acyl-CoA synthetase (AMP-forming)/AMP-acid ligase II